MKIVVTGAAGSIGANLALQLLEREPCVEILGLDSLNDYYDPAIKDYRLSEIQESVGAHPGSRWQFVKGNIADKALIDRLFGVPRPDIVENLAAQAGVRYSITNPDAYIELNLIGFYNILEACHHSYDNGSGGVKHFVYASSSSVYGSNKKVTYSDGDEELEKLFTADVADLPRLRQARDILRLAYLTGLNFIEIMGLRPADLTADGIAVGGNTVPLDEDTRALLDIYARGDYYFYPSRPGRQRSLGNLRARFFRAKTGLAEHLHLSTSLSLNQIRLIERK